MLSLSVTWIGAVYEAALDDGPEWPPHPARVFCALVAAAEEGGPDDDILRWLEAQAPPIVLASKSHSSRLPAFVPTNHVAATASNRVGRTNGRRQWERSHPRRPLFHLVWEQAEPSNALLVQLDQLARRVPFIGRSTSQAIVSTSGASPADVADLERYEPGRNRSDRLRVPYPGYLEALRTAFDEGAPARSVSRWADYGPPEELVDLTPRVVDGPWSDLVTLGFDPGAGLDGRLAVRVATAFKKAVLERVGDDFSHEELALVHGHHDGQRRQCAFLALPFVGGKNATGSILGLGLALSRDLSPEVRRALLRLLGFDRGRPRLEYLRVAGLTSGKGLALHHADGRHTLKPGSWTQPSAIWATVYPIALDRFPHRGDDLAEHLVAASVLAGFPQPDVELLPGPPMRGAPLLRGSDLRRRRDAAQHPAMHAFLRFPEHVRGPVVLGHLRHLGLGLCLPQPSHQQGEKQESQDA